MRANLSTALALGFAFLAGSVLDATPTISWQASKISETLFPGTQAFTTVTLISQVAVRNVSLRVVPQIAPYVSVLPISISSLAANTPMRIDVIFIVPAFAVPSTLNGTIQIKTSTSSVLPIPLPIVLSILQSTSN